MLREPLKIELNIPMTISREFPLTHCRPAANQYFNVPRVPYLTNNLLMLYCSIAKLK